MGRLSRSLSLRLTLLIVLCECGFAALAGIALEYSQLWASALARSAVVALLIILNAIAIALLLQAVT